MLGRGAGACGTGDAGCSRLSQNLAARPDGGFASGGGALVLGAAQLLLAHTRVEGNQADIEAVLRANGAGTMVRLDNVLLTGNLSSGSTIHCSSGTRPMSVPGTRGIVGR